MENRLLNHFLFLGFPLLALILYFPCLSGPPIWDDYIYLFHSQAITQAHSPLDFWPYGEYQRSWPVYYSYLWVLHRLFKEWYLGHHLINIIIHSFNSYLLFQILKKMQVRQAAFTALCFLIHPLNVESVAWVIQSKTLLSMLFLLLSLSSLLKFLDHSLQTREGKKNYFISLFFFALSLLSKSTSASFSIFLFLFLKFRFKKTWGQSLRQSLCFILLSGVSLLMTIRPLVILDEGEGFAKASFFHSLQLRVASYSIQEKTKITPIASPSPLALQDREAHLNQLNSSMSFSMKLRQKLIISLKSQLFYLKKLIIPSPLLLIYPKFSADLTWTDYLSLTLILLMVLFHFYHSVRKKQNYTGVWGLVFFIILLLPISGPFTMPFHEWSYVSNHWLYIPLVGLLLFTVEMLSLLGDLLGNHLRRVTTFSLLIYFSYFTFQFSSDFRSEKQLFLKGLIHYNDPQVYLENINLYFFNQIRYYQSKNDLEKVKELRTLMKDLISFQILPVK